MKFSHRLSDAIHILAYIEIFQNHDLSSKAIAESVQSNPSLVRRIMAQLKKQGILITEPGRINPKVGRPTNQVTVWDIYQALDEGPLLHIDTETNQACPVGRNIQETLNGVYEKIQLAAEAEMKNVTLADVVSDLQVKMK
ncbi:Rrf2 family transcriptional regulator [Fructilactobacillus vespulae]|uniref:Rrf2 family transcriptional regulator n=1 Tax=Fructilactobacillus vespulae TaxID=1249630 RepID=UPI0039B5D1B5